MVATDRRTSGSQLEDQTIELKAGARIREQPAAVLTSRSTATTAWRWRRARSAAKRDRQAIERIVAGVENVQRVMNETAVMEASSPQEPQQRRLDQQPDQGQVG